MPRLRVSRLLLLGAMVLTLLVAAACEEDDGDGAGNGDADGGDATATEPAGGESPEAGAADGASGGGSGAAGSAYDDALSRALEGDGIGSDAPEDLIADWNIDVMPDGTGLPEGSGTAEMGGQIYQAQCAACHGAEGEGGIGPQLIDDIEGPWEPGDPATISTWWPYATTVYDYIRRAMPFYEPGSLSDEEVYALTAYLLEENEIIDPGEEMNQDTLPQVEMPARDIFNQCWPDLCYEEYGQGAGSNGDADATPEGDTDDGTPENGTPENGTPDDGNGTPEGG